MNQTMKKDRDLCVRFVIGERRRRRRYHIIFDIKSYLQPVVAAEEGIGIQITSDWTWAHKILHTFSCLLQLKRKKEGKIGFRMQVSLF